MRSILRYVEGTEPDVGEKIKIGHETVETDGWREATHLNNIRAVLGSGLQQHLMVWSPSNARELIFLSLLAEFTTFFPYYWPLASV